MVSLAMYGAFYRVGSAAILYWAVGDCIDCFLGTFFCESNAPIQFCHGASRLQMVATGEDCNFV